MEKNEAAFNSFINDYPKEVPLVFEEETLYFNIDMNVEDIEIKDSNVDSKKVTVSVTNEYLKTDEDEEPRTTSVKLRNYCEFLFIRK